MAKRVRRRFNDRYDDYINSRLFGLRVDSSNRCFELETLLSECREVAAFWRSMAIGWASCDDISHQQQELILALLKEKHFQFPEHSFREQLDPSDLDWWMQQKSDLPLTIYRGCSSERVSAMSWSLNRKIAESFANGHRGFEVPNPVIATADVNWDSVLFATNCRSEQELLIDFKSLTVRKTETFQKV